MDNSSLAHTKWNCKYHIVFAPKYRRQIIYGKIKTDIGIILRKLCQRKGVEIHEASACPDHIHMLVSIPPKLSVSQFMGYLKGKSSLMIFDRHANLKYKYGNRQFWCTGYYVDTVGRNKKPKLQLQVEHFGKMATTLGSIKIVEKCIEKFFRGLIAKPLTRATIQFIGKMQHIGRTIVFNRNTLGDILA